MGDEDMHRTKCSAVVLLAFLSGAIISPVARATVSTWDETLNGDLPTLYDYETDHMATWQDLGTLPLGASTITGTSQQVDNGNFNTFDIDAFEITIAPGQQLSSLVMTHDTSAEIDEFFQVTGTTASPYHIIRRFPGVNVPLGTSDLLALNDDNNPGHAIGALGPGSYVLSYDNSTFNTTMNYTITPTVIPEPAMPILLGLGMMLVRARSRRRN